MISFTQTKGASSGKVPQIKVGSIFGPKTANNKFIRQGLEDTSFKLKVENIELDKLEPTEAALVYTFALGIFYCNKSNSSKDRAPLYDVNFKPQKGNDDEMADLLTYISKYPKLLGKLNELQSRVVAEGEAYKASLAANQQA